MVCVLFVFFAFFGFFLLFLFFPGGFFFGCVFLVFFYSKVFKRLKNIQKD